VLISQLLKSGGPCDQQYPLYAYPIVIVNDDKDPPQTLRVVVHWSGFVDGSSAMSWDPGNGINYFYGAIGPVPYGGKPNLGGSLNIWVTATDTKGKTSQTNGTKIAVRPCPPVRAPA